MVLKWLKVLLVVCAAPTAISLMFFYLDITSASFSIALNFSLMMWVTILESQLKPSLASRYYYPYSFEKQGELYRILGIAWYRAILVKTGWEKLRQQHTPITKSLQNVLAYERASRVAEAGHMVVGIIVLGITGYVSTAYSVADARWLILFNILLNVYPVLLQRHIRPRLQRTIARFRGVDTVSASM